MTRQLHLQGRTPSATLLNCGLLISSRVIRVPIGSKEQDQHAESTCHATMRYISIGRPSVLPPDSLTCYPSHKRPSLSDIQELAGNGRLHTTDDDIVLLVLNPTLPPTRSDKLLAR